MKSSVTVSAVFVTSKVRLVEKVRHWGHVIFEQSPMVNDSKATSASTRICQTSPSTFLSNLLSLSSSTTMSESYYFVSGAEVMLPVSSVTEEPDEDMLIAAHISTINIACDRQEETQQQKQKDDLAPATTSTTSTVVEQKMDIEEQNAEPKKSENASEEKKEKPASVEIVEAKVLQEDENCIEEDAYVAFGPGGDPGRDKALGELMDEEEEMPHKVWIRDDCYDSEDSYFDEDYFDDFDDCF